MDDEVDREIAALRAQGDDWKGEARIRDVPRALYDGGLGIRLRREAGRPDRVVCAVPGCGKVLTGAGVSGVCRAHNHAAGYCRCAYCVKRPAYRVTP